MQGQGPPATTQPPPTQTREQFREQIRQQIEDVRQATAEAGQPGGGAVLAPATPGVDRSGPTPPGDPDFFTETGTRFPDDIPPRVFDMGIAFLFTMGAIIIGLPIARALSRWLSPRAPAKLPADLTAQLAQINQSVDAIAIEVERISEAQRFATKLLTEKTSEMPARIPGSARV